MHHETLAIALRIARVCNSATIQKKQNDEEYEMLGDPTEGALLVLAMKAGKLLEFKKIDDLPFNSLLKMRASLSTSDIQELFVVGAPEIVLDRCTHVRSEQGILLLDETIKNNIRKKIETWSSNAMRVIALAYKSYSDETIQVDQIKQLVFAGITGMQDPPRPNVKESMQKCREAGIRVIMATGDHVNTALSISEEIGIINVKNRTLALTEDQLSAMNDDEFDEAIKNVNVFARLNPETKLRIASRLQAFGELVAMTGDGVNDAPVLKKVDVGIAMGIMGTDVARNASKVILADDNFATIVNAIEEGRIVFKNTRKASFYLITTNMAEICTLIAAIALGFPIPLTAIQILWLNIVTDGIGDIALAAEHGHGDVMKDKPLNKDQKIINAAILPFLAINVIIMVSCSLLAFRYFIDQGVDEARSAVFIVMSFTQLFNMYNMRSITQSIVTIGIFSNIYVTMTMISSAIINIAII
jgi:Ca2+-transporting ATPase